MMLRSRLSIVIVCLLVPALTQISARTALAQESEPRVVYDLDASGDPVHFSLRENKIIPADQVKADNWDLQFQGTSIAVNGEARLLERAFNLVAQAPESGYRADDPTTGSAIPSGNHEGWFDYDEVSHVVMPIPGITVALHLRDGTYAKLEIMSYYEGQMPGVGSPRFYTFRYVRQADGSRNLR